MSGRQGSSWASADMHYPLGTGTYASGSGTNSDISRTQHMEEANESWQDRSSYGQDFGKGPECSRSNIHKSSQFSSKLALSRSSGAQRSMGSHNLLSMQGPWNTMQGFSGSVDSSGSSNMDTDPSPGIGLSTTLGLSEDPVLAGHRYSGSSQEYSLRRSGFSPGSNPNLYPVQAPGHANIIADYTLGRGTGQGAERMGGRSSTSSGLPLAGRSTGLASTSTYHAPWNTTGEGTSRDLSLGLGVGNSFPMDRQERDAQAIFHHGSSSIYNALSDPLMASGSNSQDPLGEEATSGSDSQFFLSSAAIDRAQVREAQSLKGSCYGNSVFNSSANDNNVMSSSRASACKRKSCTSSQFVSSSCQSRFHHSSGAREGYGIRSLAGCSTGRRSSSATGCVSVSDVVASASAVVSGRCGETSVASNVVDEPRTRKSPTVRDGDSTGIVRAARSSSGVGTGVASSSRSAHNGGIAGQVDHLTSSKTQPPLARAVRRAIPALQPDPWCSQSVSLADCSSDADFATAGGSIVRRSTEHLIASGVGRRSGSPLVASSRSGSTASSRRIDQAAGSSLGDRPSHRYIGSGNRNVTPTTSGAVGSFGGIGGIGGIAGIAGIGGIVPESRVRFRDHMNVSGDSINTFGSVATQSQNLVNSQGVSRPGSVAGPSSSRLPPHPPVVRYRQNLSSLHVPMLSPPASGLAPSRLSPSPPPAATSMETLLPGSSVFQSSLLSRSSPSSDGRSERGFGSNEDSRVGFPFRGLQLSDGEHHPRLVAEGLAEILLALDRVERDEDLTYEQLLMLEATLLFGTMGLHDQHSDLRLDVDSMSYEELLDLEERIGNVNTGLTADVVDKGLRKSRYSSQAAAIAGSQESDIKCSVCQEEYEDGDELGKIECDHSYHIACIKQWLVQKNQCPICKASALSKHAAV